MLSTNKNLHVMYPRCYSLAGQAMWEKILMVLGDEHEPGAFPDSCAQFVDAFGLPEYFPEVARIEWAFHELSALQQIPSTVDIMTVNPTLHLFALSWKNIPLIFHDVREALPEKGNEFVLLWQNPKGGHIEVQTASDEELLVLKMIVEDIPCESIAGQGGLSLITLNRAMRRAVDRGILLTPPSRIRRDPVIFPKGAITDERFFTSDFFTLQWHITQSCDLQCKHCYDRGSRAELRLEEALRVLDYLHVFVKNRKVAAKVTFTGGNPLLYPDFISLYRDAAERGFEISILGNPTTRDRLRELIEIQMPDLYQVSLEGLKEHNDSIRGKGHFDRVLDFLEILRELGVYSMVMLTLTKENMSEVIPLTELLRNRTDAFHFNRLSLVGEGANLSLPEKGEYLDFLKAYTGVAENNPIMGLKDNLINILRNEQGQKPFGGCTGFGCGAAFNFLSVLPDGEVHACRKFPSPVGNILTQSISEIYDSERARQYRKGCDACRDCAIRPVCGGCFSMAYSFGLDVFREKDPFCFVREP